MSEEQAAYITIPVTDMYGNCNICGQQLGTATAGHTCVIDVSKLPKYYSESEYNLLLSSEQAWRKEALRQYPTPDAYEAVCKALDKHCKRADKAQEQLNQAVVLLKDCQYQLQQSNHPAGLGMFASINTFLSSLSQGTEVNHESNNCNSAMGDTDSDR